MIFFGFAYNKKVHVQDFSRFYIYLIGEFFIHVQILQSELIRRCLFYETTIEYPTRFGEANKKKARLEELSNIIGD